MHLQPWAFMATENYFSNQRSFDSSLIGKNFKVKNIEEKSEEGI